MVEKVQPAICASLHLDCRARHLEPNRQALSPVNVGEAIWSVAAAFYCTTREWKHDYSHTFPRSVSVVLRLEAAFNLVFTSR